MLHKKNDTLWEYFLPQNRPLVVTMQVIMIGLYTNKAKSLYNLIIISYHKYIHFLIILSENLTELEWLRPLKKTKKNLLNGGYAWV